MNCLLATIVSLSIVAVVQCSIWRLSVLEASQLEQRDRAISRANIATSRDIAIRRDRNEGLRGEINRDNQRYGIYYDREGYDRRGYGRDGFNRDGYDEYGLARDGYDSDGYDRDGYDRDGYHRYGYSGDDYGRHLYDNYGSSYRTGRRN